MNRSEIPGPLLDRLADLLATRTQGEWYMRVDTDQFGNADFYIDSREQSARHWPHIGALGICHVEGKAYDKVAADAELMSLAPLMAQLLVDLAESQR